jgi:hypothetical protein
MKRYLNLRSVGIAVSLALIICASLFLRIENVLCRTTTDTACPDEQELSQLQSASLFFVDFTQQETVVTYAAKHNMTIKDYDLHLPNTIILYFEENSHAYSLELETGEIFTVTQAGTTKILRDTELRTDAHIQLRESESFLQDNSLTLPAPLHAFLLEFSKATDATQLSESQLTPHEDFIEIHTNGSIRAFLPYEQPKQKVAQLEQILVSQSLTTLNEPVREIDLRFDLPVLRTQQ